MSLNQKHKVLSVTHRVQNPLERISDVELWEKFKEGDEASFILIYNGHFQSLFQYGCQFTPNQQLVEDAIQDVFIKIREKREGLSIKSSIKLYLFRSLRNKIIYLIDKEKKNDTAADAHLHNEFSISFSIEQRLIESQIEKEQRYKLAESMKRLTPRQREVIYYFYYENMSYSEIQELMHFNQIQGIRNLMYRALAQLKIHLTSIVALFIYLSLPR